MTRTARPPKDFEDLAYDAQVLFANAYGGDWTLAPSEWRLAVLRWRDSYHRLLTARKRQAAAQDEADARRIMPTAPPEPDGVDYPLLLATRDENCGRCGEVYTVGFWTGMGEPFTDRGPGFVDVKVRVQHSHVCPPEASQDCGMVGP